MRWALLALAAVAATIAFWPRDPGTPSASAYAGTESCRACHAAEYDAWLGSHHDQAMMRPDERTVLADFGNTTFEHEGMRARFFREGDAYRAEVDGKTYDVAYTFGVAPLQQFLFDTGNGRLQALPVAWDVANRRWFTWYDEAFTIDEGRFNWNHMCADCHSTGYRKGYDAQTGVYTPHFEEINVGCESCHGPMAAHVAEPEAPVARATQDSCAACHARRSQLADIEPHGAFLDFYDPALITEPLYHADGQIRDEVYVWGSFQQSKMHALGVHCMDCHDPHSARLKREGNATCTECHRPDPPHERFPTLKKQDYESKAHHGHTPGTEGSRCVDCHMLERVYMGVDGRRDHSFRIPRPDLTVKIGTPNACTDCHQDRPAAWAAEAARGMGDGVAADKPHYGEAFASGDRAALLRVAFGEAEPPIVRASAIARLRGDREAIEEAAQSNDPLVRLAAARAGSTQGVEDRFRAVRVHAQQNRGRMTPDLETRFAFLGDTPEGAFNRATLAQREGRHAEAEELYRASLAVDANFLPARFNLGQLLAALGRPDDAAAQFRAVLDFEPGNGQAHYALGLLEAERGRPAEAIAHLQAAAADVPRALYNLGLLHQQARRPKEALAALREAHRRLPGDGDTLYALSYFHAQRGEKAEAIRYARLLAKTGDPRAAAILRGAD
ncbi:MAG: tetratricopeptide repeat protein [Planctomycetota bacterium]